MSIESQLKTLNENLEKLIQVMGQSQAQTQIQTKAGSKPQPRRKKGDVLPIAKTEEAQPAVDQRKELSSRVVETAQKKGRDVALGVLAQFDAKKQSEVKDADVVRCLASLNVALAGD